MVIYKRFLSPIIHSFIAPQTGSYSACRFTPTCSEYARDSLKKYGIIRGSFKAAWRFLRCNPFSKGGHDPA